MGGETSWVQSLELFDKGAVGDDTSSTDSPNAAEAAEANPFIRVDLEHDEFMDIHIQRHQLAYDLPGRAKMIQQLRNILYPGMDGMDGDYVALKRAEKRGNLIQHSDHTTDGQLNLSLDEQLRFVFHQWFVDIFQGMRSYYKDDGRFDLRKWLDEKNEKDHPFLLVSLLQ
jgi:hypothetical protein